MKPFDLLLNHWLVERLFCGELFLWRNGEMADIAAVIRLAQFLEPIQSVVGKAAAALARTCSVNGKIDPYQLDQHQLAS